MILTNGYRVLACIGMFVILSKIFTKQCLELQNTRKLPKAFSRHSYKSHRNCVSNLKLFPSTYVFALTNSKQSMYKIVPRIPEMRGNYKLLFRAPQHQVQQKLCVKFKTILTNGYTVFLCTNMVVILENRGITDAQPFDRHAKSTTSNVYEQTDSPLQGNFYILRMFWCHKHTVDNHRTHLF